MKQCFVTLRRLPDSDVALIFHSAWIRAGQLLEPFGHDDEHPRRRSGKRGAEFFAFVPHSSQHGCINRSLVRYPPELSEVPADRVNQLSALKNQKIAGVEHQARGRLHFRLDRRIAHSWSLRCLVDRFSIRCIVPAAFHDWLYMGGRDQPYASSAAVQRGSSAKKGGSFARRSRLLNIIRPLASA